MADPSLMGLVAAGLMLTLGLFLVWVGLRHRPPRLADALGHLDPDGSPGSPRRWNEVPLADGGLASRAGAWAFVRLRLPLSDQLRSLLVLQGRSIGDFFAEKLIYVLLGLVAPLVGVALLQSTSHLISPIPLVGSLGLAAVGWFWPDVNLRRNDRAVRADAGEALFTYLDLVTLERLANASAAQALLNASTVSRAPLFRRVRASLERARLEQRPPWHELHRLAEELNLPELGDVADVMRLDEQGAALADALRARVAELRDAHLMAEKVAAQQVSERMTLWMTVPTLVFGLVFLAPPVLKLLGMDG